MDDERRSFPARTASWPEVRIFVERRCQELAVPRSAALRLELIAEELFVNVADHGGLGGKGQLCLQIRDCHPEVEMVLEDNAAPFDPLAGIVAPNGGADPDARPVGGLGRLLVSRLCSRSQYRRLGDRNQVTIAVRKRDCAERLETGK